MFIQGGANENRNHRDQREEIATWRAQQRPIPFGSRAVVVLIRAALEAWRKEQPTQRRRLKGQP
jgi:hypothetical protein